MLKDYVNDNYNIRRNWLSVEEIVDMLQQKDPEPVIIQLPFLRDNSSKESKDE